MELNTVMETRYSVRKYMDKKVEKEKIDELLRVSRLAPSAANRQPVRVIVVQEESGLNKIAKATKSYQVPLAFIVCAEKDTAWVREYDGKNHMDIDASIMTDHMMLKATDLGLGSVWICRFDPEIIRREFEIPDHIEPVNILAVGYPDETSTPSQKHVSRRSLEEYVFYEKLE